MHSFRRLVPLGILAVLVAACSSPSTASPVASATATTGPSASAGASAEPAPPTQPGDFTCDLPIHEQATVAETTNIVDVRVGTHDGFDRVVFEFNDGTPEISLDRAAGPFTQDASGAPIAVEGESFLRLVMRGGTKQTEDGTSSYDGSRDFDPGFPALVDLIEGGDFEAQSTWYLGLSAESCVSVTLLEDEPRLVIDIEH
jgi:hypothetical protein